MKMTKKRGILLFLVLAAVVAAIIIFHHNPGADPQEELWKKIISCGVILGACVVFVKL